MDVTTYKEFPQFKYSSCLIYSVTAALDHSPQGYWSREDTALTVTNLSQKYKMRLISISVDGISSPYDEGASFDVKGLVSLDPGTSYTVPIRGMIPAVSAKTVDITINYSMNGSATPLGTRTLVFTLTNGRAPAYDASKPYTDALHETGFDKRVEGGMDDVLERLGILDFLKMIVNSILAMFCTLRSMLIFI